MMQIRRCAVVWIEPREEASFRLDGLLSGGTGVVARLGWRAHAPHLPAAFEIEAAQVALLGALSPIDWVERSTLEAHHGAEAVAGLLEAGLLIARDDTGSAALADVGFRSAGWHAASALAHHASRWQGVDAPATVEDALVRRPCAPPHFRPADDGAAALPLPTPESDAFDALLDARSTCRNYDPDAWVPMATFSQLMARVFGARGMLEHSPDLAVLKRTSPSGGALHPTECWLVVQRVEGIAPGLYRYRIDGHALEPVTPAIAPPQPGESGTRPLGDAATHAWTPDELRAFARIAVAGQDWFADAPVLCVLAPRFHRNFWKYRNHAKAYRVATLDVGHLSQTLQLCATQAGLAPFITAAINEVDIERAFGLAGFAESPLAVCGFGVRAGSMATPEFDPNHRVWPR